MGLPREVPLIVQDEHLCTVRSVLRHVFVKINPCLLVEAASLTHGHVGFGARIVNMGSNFVLKMPKIRNTLTLGSLQGWLPIIE